MKDLIGKTVVMFVDGGPGKFTGKIKDIRDDGIVVLEANGVECRIPVGKIGLHQIVPEKEPPVMWIYMCKNDSIGCKGIKRLSALPDVELKNMPCDCDKTQYKCDFAKVGNLFSLTSEMQMAFLDGMCTRGPIKTNANKKPVVRKGETP